MPVPGRPGEAVGMQYHSCPRGMLDPRIGDIYERERSMLSYITFLLLLAELEVR